MSINDTKETFWVTGLHPKLASATESMLIEGKARGLSVGLHSGLRSVEYQKRKFALGRTIKNPDGATAEKPLGNIVTKLEMSYHMLGLAVDIVFKKENGDWTWNKTPQQWKELGDVGKLYGMEWGGDWKQFPDYPHFQMRGLLTVSSAQKILKERGLEALWKMV